jgi:hypothetical protein
MGKTMDVFTTQISPTLHETRSEIQAGGLRPHFRFLIIDSDSRADREFDLAICTNSIMSRFVIISRRCRIPILRDGRLSYLTGLSGGDVRG